ncbi:MAG TPA: sigma-70 family RNA polymerase sigma factor [Anaerohalosphaeraceae bacterium]|nr:sigma-70 family RNA polymerase sigma factor [Phycisphaerae bacterium]HOK94609.1 sigma-70 family RNA polymerase sigma factor [Anaerohalosphaeraceae bacterium]HOL32126.1 sigma-70 family RNA polymerase sigma factor [Anaerohalosphaeraceae bacterium]HOM76143.1 sigma-70 family RNA polymerase sigma factor [Anaerohalosphaeraceae bacterium]HPC63191.1 sigma-70 family RNA polymerase sigma factor [Anaerohalosphaeraceae bacterium]
MRIRISHPALRDLFDQLRFSPLSQKKKQLAAAEQLGMIIDSQQEYPYDFIVYRITGYRPRMDTPLPLISGKDLLLDLRVWIAQLSSELHIQADEQPEPLLTIQQIARRFSVSAKTVRRWQKRGLTGKMYVFRDGRKRMGFLESAVQDFAQAHSEQIQRSSRFSLLKSEEILQIKAMARELSATRRFRSRNELILEISSRLHRSRQTIRSVLNRWQKEEKNPPCMPFTRGKIGPREAAQLYKLRQQGCSIPDLMQRFRRSRCSIYRIINQQRAKELLARRLEYIDSDEFHCGDAEQIILQMPLGDLLSGRQAETVLLSRQQEIELFRRYNYLKYLAFQERSRLERRCIRSEQLGRIEKLLKEAEEVKNIIIEANMPLVASIAGRHLSSGQTLNELVSEGNMTLLAAVEKFDYRRGYRFSTYASWAIAKDFARLLPAESRRPDRAAGTDLANLPADLRLEQLSDAAAVEQAQRDLRKIIENNLDSREQYIILNHYALDAGAIPKKSKTLKQIGEELGLSQERIRQIELQALQKLRQSLSPEQFDLLTK